MRSPVAEERALNVEVGNIKHDPKCTVNELLFKNQL